MAPARWLSYSACMETSQKNAVIGVDGGATNCRFALRLGDQRVEVATGGVNVTTDRVSAIATLQDGFAQLAIAADMALADLRSVPAFLGLAGVKDDEATAPIAAALPFTTMRIAEDRLPAVIGALGDETGSIAAIGTGSFLARQTVHGIRYAGGWGLALGDEASGAWLGRALIATALRAEDGLIAPTDLTRHTLADLGGPQGAVAFAQDAPPQAFGAEPRIRAIMQAAEAGDPVATDLLQQGARYISDALTALGHDPADPLCLTGGVAPHYQRYLPPDLTILRPKGTSLDGALALAARMVRDG